MIRRRGGSSRLRPYSAIASTSSCSRAASSACAACQAANFADAGSGAGWVMVDASLRRLGPGWRHTSVMTPDTAQPWLAYSPAVAAAVTAGRPLVALESTIIAHGMPYPENVRTAREVEALIRDLGAEPATIAVIGGKIRIGLSDEELELLGRSGQAHKVSRRDLPAVLAS